MKGKGETKGRGRHSIRVTYALLFGAVVLAILAAVWGMSVAFLPRAYLSYEKRQVASARDDVIASFADEALTPAEQEAVFESVSGRYHLSLLILESNWVPRYSTYSNASILQRHLNEYVLVGEDSAYITILERQEEYVVCQVDDPLTERSYLECMGFVPGAVHYPYIISCPMEAVEETASFLGRFVPLIGLAGALIGMIAVYLASRRITGPILKLTEISEHMRNLEFHIRYEGKDRSEIGELGRNMNLLSGKLEETITDLKTANAALREDYLAKTQEEERRKGFLSDVSHELKTPISLIGGYAEGLKDLGDDPESREYYCDVILDETRKMDRLVRQITELNSLEEGRPAEMERLDLGGFLRETARSFAASFEAKGVRLEEEPADGLFVWADGQMAEEVLDNYLSNALHHTEAGGVVRIKAEDRGEVVRIAVTNTGEPIPEEILGRVWEKFFKADKARSREYGGSGIGLSIVKAIQERLGQACGAENTGDGVRFWFELEKA